MIHPGIAIVISLLLVFAVLGISAMLRRFVTAEVSRKLAHILLSHWILAALVLFSAPWAVCIPPALFVALNWYSYRKNLFRGIERDENNTPGTVWFAVSLLVLCAVFWGIGLPWIAACGMLAMGYGDGFAALVGKRFGKRMFGAPFSGKSAEGTLTVAVFSGLAVGFICAVYRPEIALRAGLVCGMVAAAAELVSSKGFDNLTLPLLVSGCVYLLVVAPKSWPLLDCLGITLAILIAALHLRSITAGGSAAALGTGLLLFVWAGWRAYAALIVFFVLGSMVSRIGKKYKQTAIALHHRHGARGVTQVAANALPALIWSAAYAADGSGRFLTAIFASFAVTAADTLSSEIGMLSKAQPRFILTGKPIRKGLSGGVTILGFCGGILGAAIMAVIAGLPRAGAVFFAGVAGTALDSVLGGACQAKYLLPDGVFTERPEWEGRPLPLVSGMPWMNNDLVNFISALAASAIALLVP